MEDTKRVSIDRLGSRLVVAFEKDRDPAVRVQKYSVLRGRGRRNRVFGGQRLALALLALNPIGHDLLQVAYVHSPVTVHVRGGFRTPVENCHDDLNILDINQAIGVDVGFKAFPHLFPRTRGRKQREN